MSNKCKWKDGKFESCENFDPDFIGVNQIVTCACCGETMWPKPEPAVIIKQSGGTWVARYDGVDYLCTGINAGKPEFFYIDRDSKTISIKWKPISDITITDEIAKLRPMVVLIDDSDVDKLYGIGGDIAILRNGNIGEKFIRLATVGDLS